MGVALLLRDVRRGFAYERNGSPGPGWKQLHERLLVFAKQRAGLEWEEGRLLCEAERAGVHRRLGYASFLEYVERLFGYNGRLVREKLRVAQAFEKLPRTSEALRAGELTWSAARELTRVATAETESTWLDAALGLAVRQVEELVSGRAPGDLPSDPEDAKLRRYVLRFEVSGETRALWLDALAKVRREVGGALDDDDVLLLMARKVLAANDGEPSQRGASYQVQLRLCRKCGHGEQIARGERHAIAPAIVAMSLCDAEVFDDSGVPAGADAADAADAPATQQLSNDSPGARVLQRAAQTIPRALRRYVRRRDESRCVVSGCKHTIGVDVHHLVARADGGQHEPDNLVCLCGAHHRAVHEGRLIIAGKPSTGLAFEHADGTRYGGEPHAGVADRNSQVFVALRGLGFKEGACRVALERCSGALGHTASREDVLRAALKVLTH